MMRDPSAIFLSAEWRKLVMINYEIDPAILKPYLPVKTEIDSWNNKYFVSLVAFRFLNTKVKGIYFPFHKNFDEINLRFYVKYKTEDGEWRRGVVFIKEIVPKPLLAFVANFVYNENYVTRLTRSSWRENDLNLKIEYGWKNSRWNNIFVNALNKPENFTAGSETEFITEHFWGYNKSKNNQTMQYRVEHPKWKIYPIEEFSTDVIFEKEYGERFAFLNNQKPSSVFLAEGSEVIVRDGKQI